MAEEWTKQYQLARELGEGRYLVVMPLVFGRARLAVATWDGPGEHW